MKDKSIIHILPWSPDSTNILKSSEEEAVYNPTHKFIKKIYDYQSIRTSYDIIIAQFGNRSTKINHIFQNNDKYHIFFPQKFIRSKFFGWQISFLLLMYLSRKKPTIIHYHGFLNNRIFFILLAIINKLWIKSKFVIHHRSYQKFPKILGIFTNLAYFLTDIIIVQNQDMLNLFKKKRITFRLKIYLIPNGIDKEIFNPLDKEKARELIELKENCIYLLWISRYAEHRQPLLMLKIFKNLVNLNKDLRLVMIGDGILRTQILRYVAINKLKDKIILKPWLNQEKLNKYYSACDIFISTSLKAGFSNVILEAMYHSLPIVAIKNQGNKELVTKRNGILTENNKNQITNAILTLINNKKRWTTMSHYSKILSKNYNWDEINNKIINIYNEIV